MLDLRIGRDILSTFSAGSFLFSWTLDQILLQEEFGLHEFAVLPALGSDHYPVMVHLCHAPSRANLSASPVADPGDIEQAEATVEAARLLGPTNEAEGTLPAPQPFAREGSLQGSCRHIAMAVEFQGMSLCLGVRRRSALYVFVIFEVSGVPTSCLLTLHDVSHFLRVGGSRARLQDLRRRKSPTARSTQRHVGRRQS